MKAKSFAIVLIALTSGITASALPANAEFNEQVLCNRRTVGVDKYKKLSVADGYDNVETYMLDSDFRRPAKDIPWSETKILEDPVIGTRIGVLDRNYIPNASRVHTFWLRNLIIAVGIDYHPQLGVTRRYEFDVMMIPAGDSYFVLRGCNGRFPVTSEVAEALRSQVPGKNIFVKLYAEGFGGGILNQIGKGTVAEWKKVYANWNTKQTPTPSELGF